MRAVPNNLLSRAQRLPIWSLAMLSIAAPRGEARAADAAPIHDVGNNRRVPDTIGPFVLESPGGKSRLRFGAAVQLLSQTDSTEAGPDASKRVDYDLGLRRLRETIKLTTLSEDLAFALQLNTTFGNIELLDLHLNYRFLPHVQVRLGQFKVPFTRYRMMSFKTLTFVDWSLVSGYFGAERQRGIAVHNGLSKQRRLAYAVGAFTGQNARASHGNGVAKMFGEDVGNPSDLVDPAPTGEIHPELVGHLSYNHGGIDTSIDTDLEKGPFRFSLGVSGAYDIRPAPTRDFHYRIAPEILIKAFGMSLFGAFYTGYVKQDNAHAVVGILVQLSYLVWRRLEISGRYGLVEIDDDFVSADADAEISPNTTTLRRDQELTLGVNVFVVGTSLRWQNDISWLYQEHATYGLDQMRFRSQITLCF